MRIYKDQSDLLKAISHPTRLSVLEILRDGEHCVCHMEAMLGLRQASISQQLMILREARIVEVRRDGLNMYYRVVKPSIYKVLDAVAAVIGRPGVRIVHKHGRTDCPCPKCNVGKRVPLAQLVVRG